LRLLSFYGVKLQLEKLIEKNYYLNKSARDGFRSYLQAYASYSLKQIFNVNHLDLAKVARAFGFTVPPKINLSIGTDVKGDKQQQRRNAYRNDTSTDSHKAKRAGFNTKHDGTHQWSR
jgi:ATP-dependent RNA helicase DDX18/HAS1